MGRLEKDIIIDIKEIIEEIKFYISMDGGDLDFVNFDIKTGIVTIKIGGACIGCHLIDETYHNGVKEILTTEIKEVKDIKIL